MEKLRIMKQDFWDICIVDITNQHIVIVIPWSIGCHRSGQLRNRHMTKVVYVSQHYTYYIIWS